MKEICNKEKCTGCMACFNCCPKKAIKMETENGFYFPIIDEEKCIDCGLCKKKCPSINKIIKYFPQENIAYAVINKNKNIRDTSSSGGVFYNIAKSIIQQNGVVYGAAWDSKLQVKHIRIENIDEIKMLQGSKYVQSNIDFSYNNVKRDLKFGKKVLFSGVPCQIAGLLSFLEKKYDNLYTCEVLCHGNASPIIFEEHKKYIEKINNAKLKEINFRYKTKEKCQNIQYKFDNNINVINQDPLKDYYYNGFQSGILLRDSCYKCNYIGIERCADITLADFWGIKKDSIKLDDNLCYPSLVFVNTKQGKELFEINKKDWNIFKRPIEEAIWGNLSLRRSVPINKYKKKFFTEYPINGYEETAKKFLIEHKGIKDRIKKLIGKNATAFLIKVLKR